MADGSALPTGITIERICGTERGRVAWADARGNFGFSLVTEPSFAEQADYSVRSNPFPARRAAPNRTTSETGFFLCELKASASGYLSTTFSLAHLEWTGQQRIVLFLQPIVKAPGTMMSATSYAAPRAAQKDYKKGLDEAKKGKLSAAQQHLESAVAAYPKYAAAWLELGNVLYNAKQPDAADRAYRQALAADPRFVPPHVQLTTLSADRRDWPATLQFSDEAIALDPIDYPSVHFLHAWAHLHLGNVEEAEAPARTAIRLDVAHRLTRAYNLLAAILLRKKDYRGAIDAWQTFLRLDPNAQDAPDIRRQIETTEAELAAASPR